MTKFTGRSVNFSDSRNFKCFVNLLLSVCDFFNFRASFNNFARLYPTINQIIKDCFFF